jgi:single-strand DNA-binding protein
MQVTVKGNLGSDPDLKFVKTQKGDTAILNFSLAYTPSERKGTEWVQGETIWFRVAVWGDKAETYADNLEKGATVLVSGVMKQSTFKGKDGTDKTAFEISATDIGIVPKGAKGKKQEVPEW